MSTYRSKPTTPRLWVGHPLARGLRRFFALTECTPGLVRDSVSPFHLATGPHPAPTPTTGPYGRELIVENAALVGSEAGLPSGNAPRTIAALVRDDASVHFGYIFGYGPASGTGQAFSFFTIGSGGFAFDTNGNSTVMTGYPNGRYYLLVASYAGGTTTLYIDGVRWGTSTIAVNTTLAPVRMGYMTAATNYRMRGRVAMAAIWDRALSGPEVALLAADPFGPVRPRSRLLELLASPPGRPSALQPPRVRWYPGLRRGRAR